MALSPTDPRRSAAHVRPGPDLARRALPGAGAVARTGLPQWRLNRAGIEWALDARLHERDWQAAAEHVARRGATAGAGRAGRRRAARALPRARPGAALAAVAAAAQPRPAPAPPDGRHDAADKLALMQGFDRMGFVERDARSGRRLVGQAHVPAGRAGAGAARRPSFEQALRACTPTTGPPCWRTARTAMRQRRALPDALSPAAARWPQRDMHALAKCASATTACRRRCWAW